MGFEELKVPSLSPEMIPQKNKHNKFDELLFNKCEGAACVILKKDDFVRDLLGKIKNHDEKTFLHSLEVGNMAAFLTKKLGEELIEKEKQILISSALLHDYGKVFVDSRILNKEGGLTAEEFLEIKEHPKTTYIALKDKLSAEAKVAVEHHEHQENSYPRKKVSNNVMERRNNDVRISKLSRILAIIDSFQSMLDPTRPSNKNKTKSIEIIVDELNREFALSEDKEIIFLLEMYYYNKVKSSRDQKNSDQKFN